MGIVDLRTMRACQTSMDMGRAMEYYNLELGTRIPIGDLVWS